MHTHSANLEPEVELFDVVDPRAEADQAVLAVEREELDVDGAQGLKHERQSPGDAAVVLHENLALVHIHVSFVTHVRAAMLRSILL